MQLIVRKSTLTFYKYDVKYSNTYTTFLQIINNFIIADHILLNPRRNRHFLIGLELQRQQDFRNCQQYSHDVYYDGCCEAHIYNDSFATIYSEWFSNVMNTAYTFSNYSANLLLPKMQYSNNALIIVFAILLFSCFAMCLLMYQYNSLCNSSTVNSVLNSSTYVVKPPQLQFETVSSRYNPFITSIVAYNVAIMLCDYLLIDTILFLDFISFIVIICNAAVKFQELVSIDIAYKQCWVCYSTQTVTTGYCGASENAYRQKGNIIYYWCL
jgi:hypothetical protein